MIERRKHSRSIQAIKQRMKFLIFGTDLLAIRGVLALAALTWAGALFCAPSSILLGNMLSILPAHIWGQLFVLQGIIMLWSLVCNRRPRVTLWADVILGTALWTSSTICILLYQFPDSVTIDTLLDSYRFPPIMVANVWVTVASWWVLVRHYIDKEDK